MPNYLLGMIQPQRQGGPAPDALAAIMADVEALTQEMKSEGVWVAAGGLEGIEAAKTVRNSEGAHIVSDGPFVEMKEYLGGFTIIDVENEEAALEWAKKSTSATTLPVEVRPISRLMFK